MALDKLVDSAQLDSDLTSVANAIRTKGGTSASLAFPQGFVSAVQNIQTGITPTGTKQITITANGTTTEDVAAYANAEITVDVQGGSGSGGPITLIATGTTTQDFTLSYDFEQSIPVLAEYLNKTDGYSNGKVIILFVNKNTTTSTSRVLRSILYNTTSDSNISVATSGPGYSIYNYTYQNGDASIKTRMANIGAGSAYEVYSFDTHSVFPS